MIFPACARVSLTPDDFVRFDLLLAMDEGHRDVMLRKAPPEHCDKVRMFLSFAPELGRSEVPDPYYGGASGFDDALDLCEAGVRGLLDELRDAH